MRGKLIVIDGVDSSGKETQTALLKKRLEQAGHRVRSISFPNYERPYCAAVKMYLAGEFGKDPSDVNAYAASTFYAVDRFASFKEDWGQDLQQGSLVLADRYTTSNAIHQGEKLAGAERTAFFDWLYDFEYRLMGLPKPDLVIFLDMPPEVADKLMEHRNNKITGQTEKDIHERNKEYLRGCYRAANEACAHFGWHHVHCVNEKGELRTIEEISDEIGTIVNEIIEDNEA